MKLTVHIGHYKTGSTAIQTHFDANREAYLANGLLYPLSGRPISTKGNHSGLAYQELNKAPKGYSAMWYVKSDAFRRYKRGQDLPARQQILREVERNQPDHVVLSSEEFIRFGGPQGVPVTTTRRLLQEFGADHIQVVCYLRRPDRYLESWYNQVVKLGESPLRLSDNLDAFLPTVHVQFFDAVSYWGNLTGVVDELTLMRYDDVRDHLVPSAIAAIGAPTDIESEEKGEPTEVNPRLPDQFVEFARVFNNYRRRRNIEEAWPVLNRLGHDPEIKQTPVYLLDANARRRLLEVFRPIDRQLAALAGTGDVFFPDIEDMINIDPDAISDVEAFHRWGMLALEAMRDEFDDEKRPAPEEEELPV
jgi:hypothetical protein